MFPFSSWEGNHGIQAFHCQPKGQEVSTDLKLVCPSGVLGTDL